MAAKAGKRKKAENRSGTERLEARIGADQKRFFQRAASLRGISLTEFMVASMHEAALKTVEEHALLTLTAHEQQVFVDTLLNPPAPNRALRMATERYDRMVSR
ncbi:MAG TPA: DUF1778 domain-containing protein [Terriglobales bacterium]|nr:DUF1778 domain-containing protein [Terriglobales bacterium]